MLDGRKATYKTKYKLWFADQRNWDFLWAVNTGILTDIHEYLYIFHWIMSMQKGCQNVKWFKWNILYIEFIDWELWRRRRRRWWWWWWEMVCTVHSFVF